MKNISIKFSACFLSLLFLSASAFGQTSAFSFQGRLNDGGNAANSNYDFQFKLFDALAGGTQVSSTITRANLQVINGVFSTTLDFGAVFGGGDCFLEISVRPSGSPNAYVVLGARQQILSVPYAVQAANALNAEIAVRAILSTDSEAFGGLLPSDYVRLGSSAVNAGNLALNGNFQQTGTLTTNQIVVANNATVGGNSTVTGSSTVGGNTTVNGTSTLNGNVVQPAAANGTAKALIYVTAGGGVNRCYNGVTGSTTGNCGFMITEPLGGVGVYRINFGFPVNNRFVVATSEYQGSDSLTSNTVSQFVFFNSTTIEIFQTRIDSPRDTRSWSFMVMVF